MKIYRKLKTIWRQLTMVTFGSLVMSGCILTMEGTPTPIAYNDRFSTSFFTPVDMDVLGNDEGMDLNISIISPPLHGVVEVDNYLGLITYSPDYGFYGMDSFEYVITDPYSISSSAKVFVYVD